MTHSTFYNRILLALMAIFWSGVVFTNYVIDPDRLIGAFNIPGINADKTELNAAGGRRTLAETILKGDYQAMIFGTSSCGPYNPEHPGFHGLSCYNTSLRGSNFYEIYQTCDFAIRNRDLKTIVLALDFHGFTTTREVSGDFQQSSFAEDCHSVVMAKYLLGFDTFMLSLRTIRNNLRHRSNTLTDRGMFNLDMAIEKGIFKRHHRRDFIVLTANYMTNQETFAGYKYGPDRIELLRKLMKRCRMNGIDLHVIVIPAHAWHLEVIRAVGLFPIYEQWLRDLKLAASETRLATADSNSVLTLWDFGGYNTVTTEPIPKLGDTTTPMKWFWDMVHCNHLTADCVLDKVLDCPNPARAIPDDFGVKLSPENMEDRILELREKGEQYRKSHPTEVEEIQQLLKATAKYRPVDRAN